MASKYVSKQEFLDMWETANGPLDQVWKKRFLARPEIEEIISFPRYAIENCLHSSPKLVSILNTLQRRWPNTGSNRPSSRSQRRQTPETRKLPKLQNPRASARKAPDLAAEGKILPLPDNPVSSRKKGSPGYRTGLEAELRSIAQKHKWF